MSNSSRNSEDNYINDEMSMEEVLAKLSLYEEKLSNDDAPLSEILRGVSDIIPALLQSFGVPSAPSLSDRKKELKEMVEKECFDFLNNANEEELKGLATIGKQRVKSILDLRNGTSEPFKMVDDLIYHLGMSTKEIDSIMFHFFKAWRT